jgi:hypothetical protein
MVTAHHQQLEESARRPATVGSLDARLSVWGQAARDAAQKRAESLVEGALQYVERVGRTAEVLTARELDPGTTLLEVEYEALVNLGANLIPGSVAQSCRLLWVDPDRLRERLTEALAPAIEAARAEVRRRQALYRRRARLWQNDQARLNRLRDEIESMRVPRCCTTAAERVCRGLLDRHRQDACLAEPTGGPDIGDSRLKLRPGTIARWIAQLDEKIAQSA